jgi:EAL domain-containing protein (putative c-di-GMP-specific phosphodiesterase class I)
LSAKWSIRADLIQFEITESALMDDPARSHELLAQLGKIGYRLFIDDFGTGYSSLQYIATLPIHALKIDKSFVDNLLVTREHRSVVAATISLAQSLGLQVVAEGVESVEQARELVKLKCDEIQGFLFSRAVSPQELEQWRSTFASGRILLSD